MTPRERSEQVPWAERGMKTIPQRGGLLNRPEGESGPGA